MEELAGDAVHEGHVFEELTRRAHGLQVQPSPECEHFADWDGGGHVAERGWSLGVQESELPEQPAGVNIEPGTIIVVVAVVVTGFARFF